MFVWGCAAIFNTAVESDGEQSMRGRMGGGPDGLRAWKGNSHQARSRYHKHLHFPAGRNLQMDDISPRAYVETARNSIIFKADGVQMR